MGLSLEKEGLTGDDDVVFVGVGTGRVVLLRHAIVKGAGKGDIGEEYVFAYSEVAE